MICVFCSADDLPALWAYRGLKRRGLTTLDIFTTEALVYNRRLEHRLQAGETITRLTLQDGRELEGASIRGVLNRMSTLPLEHFRSATHEDQLYAAQEQRAVFLSWLHGLPCTLINRPGPRGLGGDQRAPAEWSWLAGRAGLPALFWHQDDTAGIQLQTGGMLPLPQLILLDGLIYGPPLCVKAVEALKSAISRLAGLSGVRLLGVDFYLDANGKAFFAQATTLPDLRLGGERLLDALAEALQ